MSDHYYVLKNEAGEYFGGLLAGDGIQYESLRAYAYRFETRHLANAMTDMAWWLHDEEFNVVRVNRVVQ